MGTVTSKTNRRITFYSYVIAILLCLAIFLPYFREPLYSETYIELALESGQSFSLASAFSGFRQGHWLPLGRIFMHFQYLWFGLDALSAAHPETRAAGALGNGRMVPRA